MAVTVEPSLKYPLGLYWDNGKDNGTLNPKPYNRLYRDYSRVGLYGTFQKLGYLNIDPNIL